MVLRMCDIASVPWGAMHIQQDTCLPHLYPSDGVGTSEMLALLFGYFSAFCVPFVCAFGGVGCMKTLFAKEWI